MRARVAPIAVPVFGALALAATVAYGLGATAAGTDLGTPLAPFLYDWDPRAAIWAIPAAALFAAAAVLAPRLVAAGVSPVRFAATALALALALRLALAAARSGAEGWYAVFEEPTFEAANEYLPVLPAFDFGLRLFLDTFAEIATALPVHAVGHPPGLLVTLHLLGIDSAEGMAALVIGAGVLSAGLVYLLGRELLEERTARIATLLYVFAPSAVIGGAASADALFATVALLAACLLLARPFVARAAGGPALALASFFSYANLAIGAFAVLVAWRRDGLGRAAALAAACAVALAAFYGLLHLVSGFDPIGALDSAELVYREGIASTRPYEFWVFGSPAAFMLAAGIPIAWLALRALGARETVALALFAVLVTSAVLGFTKAETERIYLFLVPLLCLSAASVLPERRLPAVLGLLSLQGLATELALETIW